MRQHLCFWALVYLLVGCAASPTPSVAKLSGELAARVGHRVAQDDLKRQSIPEGVILADGVTEREAVVMALWRNPDFRASIATLNFAQADLFDANRLPNPILSLLNPVGDGLLEGTIAIPIDLLRRPNRVAAAKLTVEQTTFGLVQNGLALARDVRRGFADLILAHQRVVLLRDGAKAMAEIAAIVEQQARAGRKSGLDAAAAQADALSKEADAAFAENETNAAVIALSTLVGVALEAHDFVTQPIAKRIVKIPDVTQLNNIAIDTRPDLIAAELAVDAARKAGGFANLDILQPSAIIDLGREKGEDLKASGGASITVPLFNQGQSLRWRADAQLQRALAEHEATRNRIRAEVGASHAAYVTAANALKQYDQGIIAATEKRLTLTQRSYELGRAPFAELLIARSAANDAQLKRAEASAALRRATADINYSIGHELFTVVPGKYTQ